MMALTEEQKRKLQAKAEAEIAARKQKQEEEEYYAQMLAKERAKANGSVVLQDDEDGYGSALAKRSMGNTELVNDSIFMEAKISSIETVVEARVSLFALVPSIISAVILVLLMRNISSVVGIILGTLIIVLVYVNLCHIKLSVSNKKVCGQTGIFCVNRMESPLDQINNVKVEYRFLGSLLGYGTIAISTASGEYYFQAIKDADDFQQEVTDRIHKYKEDYATRQAVKIAMAMREAGMTMDSRDM